MPSSRGVGGRTYTTPPGYALAGYVVAGAAMAYAAAAYATTARAAGEGLGSLGASEVVPFTAKALRSFSLFLCENKQVCWWVSRISALYLNVHNLLQRRFRGRRLPRHCFRRRKIAASRKTSNQLGKCRGCSEGHVLPPWDRRRTSEDPQQ